MRHVHALCKAATSAFVMCAVLLFFVFPVSAGFKNTPVTAYIPVICKKADVSGSNKYEVVIESLEEGNPMPAKNVYTFNGSGQLNIEIEMDEPGTYQYKIYERKGKNKKITYDDTVYTVTLFVTQDDEGVLECEVILSKGGLVKPTEVKFVNKAAKRSDSVIATGESSSAFIPFAVAAFAISGVIVVILAKRRREEAEDA